MEKLLLIFILAECIKTNSKDSKGFMLVLDTLLVMGLDGYGIYLLWEAWT